MYTVGQDTFFSVVNFINKPIAESADLNVGDVAKSADLNVGDVMSPTLK
ncbi:hypothetical protein LTSEALA_2745 [Salmonella enterica subsp. enterica serovar Alachua str. R6-377]|uniref:Uncharacterized protein n=1 Tax=Salmonella enterica subsp. enterica serovar Alachua str. R6-377 TaxID=913241 RepID=G5LPS0_SALET|nr:hypothetical protein LTSEALA_2745 [Salmonella enterica subsp. enterica serovar Alachua str. R6-377]